MVAATVTAMAMATKMGNNQMNDLDSVRHRLIGTRHCPDIAGHRRLSGLPQVAARLASLHERVFSNKRQSSQ